MFTSSAMNLFYLNTHHVLSLQTIKMLQVVG